jgi:hypothetical protein
MLFYDKIFDWFDQFNDVQLLVISDSEIKADSNYSEILSTTLNQQLICGN